MEYRTMNRKELAAEMGISPEILRRRMKKELSENFQKVIKGNLLLKNHVKHVYETLSGLNEKW